MLHIVHIINIETIIVHMMMVHMHIGTTSLIEILIPDSLIIVLSEMVNEIIIFKSIIILLKNQRQNNKFKMKNVRKNIHELIIENLTDGVLVCLIQIEYPHGMIPLKDA